MIIKIFSVATFILVAWLTVNLVNTSNHLENAERQLNAKIDSTEQTLTSRISELEDTRKQDQEQMLTVLTEQVVSSGASNSGNSGDLKAEADSLREKLRRETHLKELKTAYRQVIETEFEKSIDASKAAEKILSTKEAIWKASMKHENVKDDLRGLMGPIDSLAAKWKRGETDNTVKPVFSVLQQTLATLDTP